MPYPGPGMGMGPGGYPGSVAGAMSGPGIAGMEDQEDIQVL